MPAAALGLIAIALVLSLATGKLQAQEPDWPSMDYTLHRAYQAVDGEGRATFPMTGPIKMRGIMLNAPEYMLDATPGAPGFMGGLWQVFIQAVDLDDTVADDGDFGGTALWEGQYIGKMSGNHPAGSYTDTEFQAEMDRLNHDPLTAHLFRPGDLVEVRARAPGLPYRGKTNINEQHSKSPEADFDLVLLEAGRGMPEPASVTLADLKDAENHFIFDATRMTGCERHQGAVVCICGVTFVDPSPWGPGAVLEIQDGTGRTFPVLLGLHPGFTQFPPPTGAFDLVAILDQEDGTGDNGLKDGYRLWTTVYGGGNVVGVSGPRIVAAVSRRTHGAAGVFDLPLAVTGQPTVEPRQDGQLAQLVLTFDDNVVPADGTPDCGEMSIVHGQCAGVAVNGNQMILDMTFDPNTCVAVTVGGMNSAGTGLPVVADAMVRVLARPGDVTGDNVINIVDLQQVKSGLFQPVGADNFGRDVSADGQINIVDLQATKSNLFTIASCE